MQKGDLYLDQPKLLWRVRIHAQLGFEIRIQSEVWKSEIDKQNL